MKKRNAVLLSITLLAIGMVASWKLNGSVDQSEAMFDVTVPQLSVQAQAGEQAYNNTCIACHGLNAAGTKAGPPLVHKIYEPSHHGDQAFYRAAANGVQAHHWQFGDMPKQNVSESDMHNIVAYLRELQRANGIF